MSKKKPTLAQRSVGSSASSDSAERNRSKSKSSNRSIGIVRKPSSVTSLASQYRNLTHGRYTAQNVEPFGMLAEAKAAEHIDQYGENLYDTVVIYLSCPTHKKVALPLFVSKGRFLPYGPIRGGESWLVAVSSLIQRVLCQDNQVAKDGPMFTTPELLDILRVQLPRFFEYLTRVCYRSKITPAGCKAGMCNENSFLGWFPESSLDSMMRTGDKMLGPEAALFGSPEWPKSSACREITMADVMLHQVADVKTVGRELLRHCAYGEKEIMLFYGDYLQHCFPSEYMTLGQFMSYFAKLKLVLASDQEMAFIFNAFARNQVPYINFHEFLLGLAMIDLLNATQSSTGPAVSAKLAKDRSDFLFRYFAQPGQDYLTEAELNKVLAQFKISNHSDAGDLKKAMLVKSQVLKDNFTKAITSLLAMANNPKRPSPITNLVHPLTHIGSHQAYPRIELNQMKTIYHKDAIQARLSQARQLCENCRSKKYTLAMHLVKMSTGGIIYEPTLNNQPDVAKASELKRKQSENFFNRSLVCNQLADTIRQYATKIKIYRGLCDSQNELPDWSKESVRMHSVDKIIHICKQAQLMFQKGGRVIKVTSPCYILGDIHGNLHDLLIYEKVLWKRGPYMDAANFLFLGDYVDRGDYSVECILFLLCMKLQAPNRIFMLRGNHESREIQTNFTFPTECRSKFGERAPEVFEAFHNMFDEMPLVAILDDTIYCAHGGIPSCAKKISQIMQVSRNEPLSDPDNNEIANEVLWNDPMTDQEYFDLVRNGKDIVADSAKLKPGFMANSKRSTGCFYSEMALREYFEDNSLTHVIRAHECIPSGYQYHAGGKCITIFSCSRYVGLINEAAIAFAHDSKIRVIKMDTPLQN